MVADIVEDEVVAAIALGEIRALIVDGMIGADPACQICCVAGAHCGHFRAERPPELHGEGADSAHRAVHQ
jgi:hypothetical protein